MNSELVPCGSICADTKRCGRSFDAAYRNCNGGCDSPADCPEGISCFSGLSICISPHNAVPAAGASTSIKDTTACDPAKCSDCCYTTRRCGHNRQTAMATCGFSCPNVKSNDCPVGQQCYDELPKCTPNTDPGLLPATHLPDILLSSNHSSSEQP